MEDGQSEIWRQLCKISYKQCSISNEAHTNDIELCTALPIVHFNTIADASMRLIETGISALSQDFWHSVERAVSPNLGQYRKSAFELKKFMEAFTRLKLPSEIIYLTGPLGRPKFSADPLVDFNDTFGDEGPVKRETERATKRQRIQSPKDQEPALWNKSSSQKLPTKDVVKQSVLRPLLPKPKPQTSPLG